MNHRRYLALICFAFVSACSLTGCVSTPKLTDLARTPDNPVQHQSRYDSLNAYQRDALYFATVLQETHPEPFRYITKEAYDAETERLVKLFANETSDIDFRIELRKLASRLRDSHTQVSGGNLPDVRSYPLRALWMGEKLHIGAVEEKMDTTLIGSEVLALNSTPIKDAAQRVAQYYSYDNFGWIRWKILPALFSPYILRREGITTSDSLWIAVKDRTGKPDTVMLLPVNNPKLRQTNIPYAVSKATGAMYSYVIDPEDSLCYFQWNTMMDKHALSMFGFFQRISLQLVAFIRGVGYFDDFLDDMFDEMHEKNVHMLVIDMRGNTGGNTNLAYQLLYKLGLRRIPRDYRTWLRLSPLYREMYPDIAQSVERLYMDRHHGLRPPDRMIPVDSLYAVDTTGEDVFGNIMNPESDYYVEPPEYPFDGSVYFISGEGTYSSGSILLGIVKDNHLFTIVGQPAGQGSHYGEILMLRLPNTDTYCQISSKKFARPDESKALEQTIHPDVEIWPTMEDFQQGRDDVLEWIVSQERNKNVVNRK